MVLFAIPLRLKIIIIIIIIYYKCPAVRTHGADHIQTFAGFVSMSFPSHGLVAREHHLAQISGFRDPYTLNKDNHNNNDNDNDNVNDNGNDNNNSNNNKNESIR